MSHATGEADGSFPRLTSAIERNAQLTRDLQDILQDTLKLTQSTDYGAVEFSEPEYHTKLDMGKLRLIVSIDGAPPVTVPCDHRQSIAELIDLLSARSRKHGGSLVTSIMCRGSLLEPSDMIGDLLVDGERIEATGKSAIPLSRSPSKIALGDRKVAFATEVSGPDDEVDMSLLMRDILGKIEKADKALKAKALEEKRGKMQAEALLHIFRTIASDKSLTMSAISNAVLKLLNAETVNIYLVINGSSTGTISGKSANEQSLVLAHSACYTAERPEEHVELFAGKMCDVKLGQGIVGRAAAPLDRRKDTVTADSSKHYRTTCVDRGANGTFRLMYGSDELKAGRIDSIVREDPSFNMNGSQLPGSFMIENALVYAVSYVAPSKSMVTFKTDEELREVFDRIDTDGGGTLDRDEIAEGMKSLGKRLTKAELDEAMRDMDEDGGGDVDYDEFAAWWRDSLRKVELGQTVAVVQVCNKGETEGEEAGQPGFGEQDRLALAAVMAQVAHILKEQAEELEFNNAKKDNKMLNMFAAEEVKKPNRTSPRGATLSHVRRTQSVPVFNDGDASSPAIRHRKAQQILSLSRGVDLKLPDIEALGEWSFPALEYSAEQLVGCVLLMFSDLDLLSQFKIGEAVMHNFTTTLFSEYNKVPYHNFHHGFNVFQGCYWLIKKKDSGLSESLDSLEILALLLAALGHDTGHDGFSNNFHMNSYDEVAVLYNDQSILESMHARKLFEVAKSDPSCNVFAGIPEQFKQVRKMIIKAILGTDMAGHQEKMKKLDKLPRDDLEKGEDKEFWVTMVLHAIDIGNPAMVWKQAYRWARMCITEFKMQFVLEERKGLETTAAMLNIADDLMIAKYVPKLAKSQIGFAQFVVWPCFKKIAAHIPVFDELLEEIKANNAHWKELEQEGSEIELPSGAEKVYLELGEPLLHPDRA